MVRREISMEVNHNLYGYRLDRYLVASMPWYSRKAVQQMIAEGQFLLNGKPVKKSTRIKVGDILFRSYEREEPIIDINLVPLPILYEDENIIAVNKPPTIAVHPNGAYQSGTLVQLLEEKYGFEKLRPVHRLDKETSGTIIMAKNKRYATYLIDLFYQRKIKKQYLAIVKGEVAEPFFTVKVKMGTVKSLVRLKQWVTEDGGFSHTDFRVIKQYPGYALVEANIHTGRQHQIRVHMAYSGNYIVGDKIYGPDEMIFDQYTLTGFTREMLEELETPRHLLHAYKLSFHDELSGRDIAIRALLPDDMSGFIKKIK